VCNILKQQGVTGRTIQRVAQKGRPLRVLRKFRHAFSQRFLDRNAPLPLVVVLALRLLFSKFPSVTLLRAKTFLGVVMYVNDRRNELSSSTVSQKSLLRNRAMKSYFRYILQFCPSNAPNPQIRFSVRCVPGFRTIHSLQITQC